LTADGRWLVVGGAATAYLSILDAQTLAPLKKIKTAGDATDNLISVDGGRKIVATAGYSLYRSNAARHLFVLDARAEPELLGKVEVGINPGFHLNLGDGTVLVPAVHGQRITRVDTRDKKALESMSTRKWRFHPTWASGRSDQRIAVITGGAFRGGRMPFGEKLLVLDPMSPSKRARFEFYRGLAQPRGALFHPDGRHILVANRLKHTLAILDWVDRQTVGQIPVGRYPEALGMMPDGKTAWLVYSARRSENPRLTFIDLEHGTVSDVALPGATVGKPVTSPDGRMLYVPVKKRNGVAVIEVQGHRLIDFIETQATPGGLVIHPLGDRLYVVQKKGTLVSMVQ
jgi:DNA-binding beta-propeller fold protein YncE